MNGWVLIHRQIADNDYLWQDKPFSRGQAWIDLIMTAEIADTYSQRYQVTIRRGQQIVTIRYLAERWGWSKSKVFDFLNSLKSAAMANIEADTKRTVLTIANYDKYQNAQTPKGHKKDTAPDTKRTSTLLNKEPKEVIKEPKEEKETGDTRTHARAKRFKPPTVDEVTGYCLERNNNIDPEAFVAFYASKGWKVGRDPMEDWKAAVITWEKRDKAGNANKKSSNPYLDMAREDDAP